MKIETTYGEAREVIAGQVAAVSAMLNKMMPMIQNGRVGDAYKACDFDLIKRMTSNLEECASENV